MVLLYVSAQLAGAIVAAMIIGLYFFVHEPIYSSDKSSYEFPIISEYLGTTLMTVIYLSQTQPKTQLTNQPLLRMLIYTVAYIGVLALGTGPFAYMPCLNPTVALGVLMNPVSHDIVKIEDAIFVYIIPPIIGTLTGIILFHFIYKRGFSLRNLSLLKVNYI